MFSNLKIGLRIDASIPAESFNSFSRQHVTMLRDELQRMVTSSAASAFNLENAGLFRAPTAPPASNNVADNIVNIINSLDNVIGNIFFPPGHDLPCLLMNFQIHYFSI